MKKTMVFTSFDEYEEWTEQFEECADYEEIPTVIDDGWKISADMFTECKSWKTALRRFKKAFEGIYPEIINDWTECMIESCESGYFKDTTGCKPSWTNDPEEIEKFQSFGTYSWGVEETCEGCWYIFLNISGDYAGRETAVA